MRPVLLGMNNPNGGDPMDPLGITGLRLISMVGEETFNAFDRDNVLREKLWRRDAARKACADVRLRLRGRTVLALGNEVWAVLGLPKARWFDKAVDGYTTWWRIPHPSGKNLQYNDAKAVTKLKKIMEDLAK